MVSQISPQDLARKLADGEAIYLLDVRFPQEHAFVALPNSQLIPLPELSRRIDEVQPPAGALVVVYCHHGVRSLTGAAILANAGVESVASLTGGIDAWSVEVDANVARY
jgi:adenylyltransferase/sulfurtransferase